MRTVDVLVIGAGPAGLSAAAELVSRGARVLVVDAGPPIARRERSSPDDLLSGVGGAGLFSDGKFAAAPAASGLWALPVEAAFAVVKADLASQEITLPTSVARPETVDSEWQHKPYEVTYAGIAARLALIDHLVAAANHVESGRRVVSVARDGETLVATLERERVRARGVIIATGRWSARWIRPWLEALGARYEFRCVEFGVRLESGASHPMFAKLPGTDGKLRFVDQAAHSEIRTFATCRNGEVAVGHADGIRAFSGRADCPKTGRSNVGLLVRGFHPALAREVLRYVDRASPTSLPLATWLDRPALLDPVFGTAGTLAIVHAVQRFATWAPELDREVVVHAPAVESIGEYPALDDALCAAPNVWIAGDTGGKFRGIVAAMVSGRYVAANIRA